MTRYSLGAILLHWLIAIALAFELALGFGMPRDTSGFALFQLHKSVGIAILALTILRLVWRLVHPRPDPVSDGLSAKLAKAVHWGFYLFMVLAPLTGWALVSTAEIDIPTVLFGIVPLPHLPLADSLNAIAEEAHEWLAWIGLGLIALHIAGALRHEILLRDRLLERMSPGGSRTIGALLALGVILVGAWTFRTIDTEARLLTDETSAKSDNASPAGEASEAAADDPAIAVDEAAENAPGAVPDWTIRPGGRLGFSVGNGDAGTIAGSFSSWSGDITFDPERPETADIRISVDLSSASVGDDTQDTMLKGDEFFAVGQFGRAQFVSRRVRKTGANSYSASGTLQLKGATLPQTISFRLAGNGLKRRVEGSAAITRSAFGIGTGPSAEGLDPVVSVNFSFEADGKLPAN